MKDVSNFLPSQEEKEIVSAIAVAEQKTSGEIRIHIENLCKSETVLDRTAYIFDVLSMQQTDKRNGILLYIAVMDQRVAIIGDVGINRFLAEDFWDCALDELLASFGKGLYKDGIITVLQKMSDILAQYFPVDLANINELPNDISYG